MPAVRRRGTLTALCATYGQPVQHGGSVFMFIPTRFQIDTDDRHGRQTTRPLRSHKNQCRISSLFSACSHITSISGLGNEEGYRNGRSEASLLLVSAS